MAFIAFLIIAGFVLISYFIGNRDLLSPWFLLCLMLFATFAIVLFNYANWEVDINGWFVLYLSTAIVAFGLGVLLIKALCCKSSLNAVASVKVPLSEANVKRRYPTKIFLLISIVFTALYVMKLFSDNPGAASLSERLRKIYDNIVYNDYSPGFLFNQMREVITAIAYVNTYRLFVKLFSKKDSVSAVALILPMILFVVMLLATSDRNIFLRYAFYFICLYVLFFYENCKQKNANIKIVKRILVIGIFVVIIFFILGKLKQYNSNITRAISIYGGSGLYNFNLFIKDFNEPLTYGTSTFSTFLHSLQSILSYIGINLNIETQSRFDAFITYQSSNGYVYSSNIYSALKPFVEDFGYFGVILFPFIIGAFYQWLYLKMKKSKYGFGWVVYSMLIYPVLFFPIAEQLFGRLNLGFVYELFWLTVLFYAVYGRRAACGKQINKVSEVYNA